MGETGKRKDRPELAKALAHCRRAKATLVVAKLDRLARNVAFTSALMESGVDFVCCGERSGRQAGIGTSWALGRTRRSQAGRGEGSSDCGGALMLVHSQATCPAVENEVADDTDPQDAIGWLFGCWRASILARLPQFCQPAGKEPGWKRSWSAN